MQTFESITEYKKSAKKGDRLALEGIGLLNGLHVNSKYDTFTFVGFNEQSNVNVKKYRGRTKFKILQERQRVKVLTAKEFNNLTSY